MKVGRKPWTPTESDIERAEHLAGRGFTLRQIAHSLGVAQSTLYEKMREIPEFSERIKKGHGTGIEQISNKLFEAALNGNLTAAIFFLKSRAGWKEGGASVDVQVPPLPPPPLFKPLFESESEELD